MLKENEEWKSKSTSKNDNMEKNKKWGRYKQKKISSENVHEKIKSSTHVRLKVTGINWIMLILKQPLKHRNSLIK